MDSNSIIDIHREISILIQIPALCLMYANLALFIKTDKSMFIYIFTVLAVLIGVAECVCLLLGAFYVFRPIIIA